MIRAFGWLAKFAILGLLTVALIGPVVGVVGALLPFAVIGGVGWLVVRGARGLFGRRPRQLELRPVEDVVVAADAPAAKVEGVACAKEADAVVNPPLPARRRLWCLLGLGLCWCREAVPAVGDRVRAAGEETLTRLRMTGRVLGEIFYGAAAGGLLACAFAGPEVAAIMTGILAGTGLGLVVGLATARRQRAVAAE